MTSASDFSKAVVLLGRLFKLLVGNPRGLREVSGVALSVAGEVINPEIDVLPIPAVTLEQLIAEEGEAFPLHVHAFPQEPHSISLLEAIGLAVLMRKARARRAFEFGTHRGVSSTQLAGNLPEDGELFTLDLPRDDRRTQFTIDNPGDLEVSQMPAKADLVPAELLRRVRFLEQDSACFDPALYAGAMDFVFVDGAHTTDYVRNDSEKAWAMLRPGGILAWHDCRSLTPDVVRYLRQCSYGPRRLVGGTLAFAIKPAA